jgi:hypothetical protein
MSEGNTEKGTISLSTESVGALADELEARWHRTGEDGTNPERDPRSSGPGNGKRLFLWGAASGLAFAIAAPLLSKQARPMMRGMVKGGLVAGKYIQRTAASIKEEVEDITAEAKAALDREQGA